MPLRYATTLCHHVMPPRYATTFTSHYMEFVLEFPTQNGSLFEIRYCLVLCRILANIPKYSYRQGCVHKEWLLAKACLLGTEWVGVLEMVGFCDAGYCFW